MLKEPSVLPGQRVSLVFAFCHREKQCGSRGAQREVCRWTGVPGEKRAQTISVRKDAALPVLWRRLLPLQAAAQPSGCRY